jgi:hypothetical protein
MLRPKFKIRTRTIAGDKNANNHNPLPGNDPLIGTIIITDGHSPFLQLMSGNIGGFDKDSGSVADSEDAGTNVSISEALKPLTTILDCPEMNSASCEMADGVFVSGWTCGHCPHPPQGTANFFKHQNTTPRLSITYSKILDKTSNFVRVIIPFRRNNNTKPCTTLAL